MFLFVDAGNSWIKWACCERSELAVVRPPWGRSGKVAHAELGQLAHAWQELSCERVCIANVAGPAVAAQLAAVCRSAGLPEPQWFNSEPVLAGIRNGYREPSQLGCDRFASLIGARALFPDRPLIVATCGTATTIDALTAAGDFIGGMILPGPGLMAASLGKNTAQLPQLVQLAALPPTLAAGLFADDTESAIAAGCIAAQAGAIDRAVAKFSMALGISNTVLAQERVACILSGGGASVVAPHLSAPCHCVDNLVLVGLARATHHFLSC